MSYSRHFPTRRLLSACQRLVTPVDASELPCILSCSSPRPQISDTLYPVRELLEMVEVSAEHLPSRMGPAKRHLSLDHGTTLALSSPTLHLRQNGFILCPLRLCLCIPDPYTHNPLMMEDIEICLLSCPRGPKTSCPSSAP